MKDGASGGRRSPRSPDVLAGRGGLAARSRSASWNGSRSPPYPLAVIPFATSIVLVIGSPEAEPAAACLIGGHLVRPGRVRVL